MGISILNPNYPNFKFNTMKRYIFLVLIFFSGLGIGIQAGNPNNIVGIWKSPSNDLMIKIDKIGNHFQGRIVWIAPAITNHLLLDEKNPNEQLRHLPLKGNKVIQQLKFNSEEAIWDGGIFYNYNEGKHYYCKISLRNTDQIEIFKISQQSQDQVAEMWIRQK